MTSQSAAAPLSAQSRHAQSHHYQQLQWYALRGASPYAHGKQQAGTCPRVPACVVRFFRRSSFSAKDIVDDLLLVAPPRDGDPVESGAPASPASPDVDTSLQISQAHCASTAPPAYAPETGGNDGVDAPTADCIKDHEFLLCRQLHHTTHPKASRRRRERIYRKVRARGCHSSLGKVSGIGLRGTTMTSTNTHSQATHGFFGGSALPRALLSAASAPDGRRRSAGCDRRTQSHKLQSYCSAPSRAAAAAARICDASSNVDPSSRSDSACRSCV